MASSNTVREPRRFSPVALRRHMADAGYDSARLAVAVGKSSHTIYAYTLGRVTPPADVLADIAHELDCEIGDFFAPRIDS
jgi:transcriptional regulator with XRE-family HTH domain